MRAAKAPTTTIPRLASMIQQLQRDGYEVIYLGDATDQHGRPTDLGAAPPTAPAPELGNLLSNTVTTAEMAAALERLDIAAFEERLSESIDEAQTAVEDAFISNLVRLPRSYAGTKPLAGAPGTREGRVERIDWVNSQFVATLSIYNVKGDGFLSNPAYAPVSVLELLGERAD